MKKLITIFFVLILTIITVTGCSSSHEAPYNISTSMAAAMPEAAAAAPADFAAGMNGDFARGEAQMADEADDAVEAPMEAGGGPATGGGDSGATTNQVISDQKIIRNVDIQLQTLTFDSGVDSIQKLAKDFGGFVQDSYIEGRDMYNERGQRFARFTIRVPAGKLDDFVNSLGGGFNVISKGENAQDITEAYFDSKARLDSLKIQEERLLAMLETAAELEYLLQVEKELMNVRYEIESLTSSLKRMDSYVSLSTVNIMLNEVIKYEHVEEVPATFSERISRAFSTSLKNFSSSVQNFAVGFVLGFPYILVLAVIAMIIILIIRMGSKKRAARKELLKQQNIMYQKTQLPHQPDAPAKEAEKTDKND